eukprot:TRINITY_DN43484_c0_g1_i1.p1 TRINITY_DN43484_c0_g1~~TRINITY_DN43484_c0_g1_i1.p1  ORF type:complete len:579 (-),score=120.67 TRINITY_DN43484_c0_g1_i1:54-1790(-)
MGQKKKAPPPEAKSCPSGDARAAAPKDGRGFWRLAVALAVLLVVVAAVVAQKVSVAGLGPGSSSSSSTASTSTDSGSREAQRKPLDISDLPLEEMPTPSELGWRVVSETPRIYVRDNFISDEESKALRRLVAGRLQPAMVVQKSENKHDTQVNVRNNKQIWLSVKEERDTPVVHHVLKRMHRAARHPEDDAEALQIGHYGVDEKYEVHQDSDPTNDVARPMTMIVYLNTVKEGGETLFPLSSFGNCTMKWRTNAQGEKVFGAKSCCESEDYLRIAAKKGRAVLFFNHDMAGNKDRLAEHAACPIKQGEKWIAQRWFRYEPYQRLVHPPDQRFDGWPSHGTDFASVPRAGRMDLRTLSQKSPAVHVIEDFFSEEECKMLVDLAQGLQGVAENGMLRRWVPAEVEAGNVQVTKLAKRMHRAALVPETHAEIMQLGSYEPGSFARLHLDSSDAAQRPWTIIVYLTGDGSLQPKGEGATIFPRGAETCKDDIMACCAMAAQQQRQQVKAGKSAQMLLVPPKVGRAVLFRSLTPQGVLDPHSLHGSCPAGPGGKWIAQKWFRTTPQSKSPRYEMDPEFDGPPS